MVRWLRLHASKQGPHVLSLVRAQRFHVPRGMVKKKTEEETKSFILCVCETQLCPTLCDPMDCSPPGSSVHGILQARILEWVPIPSSRGSP